MSKTCEFCNQREATALCTVCDQIFCDECQAGYKRVKFTANHQFVALDSSEKILSEESIGKGDTTLGVVHRPHSFVVNAGNLGVQNILTVDVRRGFSPLVEIKNLGKGQHEVKVTCKEAGKYEVDMQIHKQSIQNCPFDSHVATQKPFQINTF